MLTRTILKRGVGTNEKFYIVEVDGSLLITRWGRAGAFGLSSAVTCTSGAEAIGRATQIITGKLQKGYVQTDASTSPLSVLSRSRAIAIPARTVMPPPTPVTVKPIDQTPKKRKLEI